MPGPSPDVGDDGAVRCEGSSEVRGRDRVRRHGCPWGSGGELGKAGVAVVGQRGEQLPVGADHDERPAAGELGDLAGRQDTLAARRPALAGAAGARRPVPPLRKPASKAGARLLAGNRHCPLAALDQ